MRSPFYLNGTQLECVRSYKYLGFIITPSGEILSGLQDLRDRGYKGPCKKYVTPKIGIFDPPPHVTLCHILVRPPPPHVTHQRVTISDGEK